MEKTTLAIVVAGSMNPPIHSPEWYSRWRILTEDEVDRPVVGVTRIQVPDLCQFRTDRFEILCLPDRWQIIGRSQPEWDAAKEVCKKTFEQLVHTPVSAFGFNFSGHLPVPGSTPIAHRLGRSIGAAQIGFVPSGELKAVRIAASWPGSVIGSTVTLVLEPSMRGPDRVFAQLNINHPIIASPGFFNMSPLLDDGYHAAKPIADATFQKVVRDLEQAG